jgi:hypothetical protein
MSPHSKPPRAAAPIEAGGSVPCARPKWLDLHSALAQLLEAQALAADKIAPVDEART